MDRLGWTSGLIHCQAVDVRNGPALLSLPLLVKDRRGLSSFHVVKMPQPGTSCSGLALPLSFGWQSQVRLRARVSPSLFLYLPYSIICNVSVNTRNKLCGDCGPAVFCEHD